MTRYLICGCCANIIENADSSGCEYEHGPEHADRVIAGELASRDYVIDEPTRFGFVYATLPDHPEQGYESFVVSNVDGEIVLQIDAVSRPGIPIVRLGAPVTRLLQRRASDAYLAALRSWVTAPDKHL